jgi:hypothetical protein
MNAINKEVEWQDMTFSYTSKDDEYNDYEWKKKGPALEIYGTDLTYLHARAIRRMFCREAELLALMEIW